MKKWLLLVMAFCCFLFGGFNTANADYPLHLYGDPNFILVDAHMGTGWYLDRSSLNVQKYAPPQYIIAINIVSVRDADRGNTSIYGVTTKRFLYNWNTQAMYVERQLNSNDWRYLKPRDSWANIGISMPAGEMAFYLAYNMKFYGSRSYLSPNFYNRVY
ncbi:hypothetical protein [Veillonella atypica]|uniref:hypothetical protein n=1 Tax=Veillonella atypica TaxID=39777 RepID=UPI00352C99E3